MRILGIDLGSTSIKAVEVDSAFGRFEIHEYHEHPIASGTDPAAAVAHLIQSLPKAADRTIVSMRPSLATFRNSQLPTRDRKAIAAGVAFELEDELPFPIESTAYDYTILNQAKGVGTYLHIAATLKKNAAAAIEFWKENGVDPDVLTTETWAYRTYLNRLPKLEAPVLLVQIGHEKTTIYGHWRGSPVMTRELDWGGRDLTLAISQKYKLPLDEAERAKLAHGFVIPPSAAEAVSAEQIEFSDALKLPLEALISAIRQSTLTCKNITQQAPVQIYLSGGGCQLPGLPKLIEESLKIPTQILLALTSVTTSGITYSEHADSTFLLAASLALTAVGPDRATTINFRKGDFSKAGKARELNLSSLRKPAMATGAVLACMFLSLGIQWKVYQSRMTTVNTALERSVKSFFGTISSSAVKTYMTNTPTLRTAINREITKQEELAKLFKPNPSSPLDFLKELSASVPKDLVVDLVKYQVGAAPSSSYFKPEPADAELTFIVANPQVAERLAQLLPAKLSGMTRGKMQEVAALPGSAAGAPKRWQITFNGKPTEDSYGK